MFLELQGVFLHLVFMGCFVCLFVCFDFSVTWLLGSSFLN